MALLAINSSGFVSLLQVKGSEESQKPLIGALPCPRPRLVLALGIPLSCLYEAKKNRMKHMTMQKRMDEPGLARRTGWAEKGLRRLFLYRMEGAWRSHHVSFSSCIGEGRVVGLSTDMDAMVLDAAICRNRTCWGLGVEASHAWVSTD